MKNKKILYGILIFAIMLLLLQNIVCASSSSYDWSGTISDIEGAGSASAELVTTTQTVLGTIITVMKVVGVGVGLIMLMYIGIKYMVAAPSEKADFKKSATGFIVGAIVLFGASGILQIIQQLSTAI